MTGPATILVADDDRSIRAVLAGLSAWPRSAHRARRQIWLDRRRDRRSVITDVVMPDESVST
jgi:DNA-binding NtrC family response regulator